MADNGATSDFQIPDEILSVIPMDPYEQLALARKITSLAIASRVSKLEYEAGLMYQKISDKDRVISELHTRISELENMFRETDARLRTALEDNIKLSKERDSLLVASKKMHRDLTKMETFKRHLMQSLNDDNTCNETVDIATCDQSVAKTTPWNETSSTIQNGTNDLTEQPITIGRHSGKRSITSYISPKFTPCGTTPTVSSPKGFQTKVSPKMTSVATSPTKSMSPWYPSSKQSSLANSPPRERGRARVDGKEFFRQARSRLSYEQFAAFLANIKELNAHRQSREETLKKAEEIFGTQGKDLYLSFQGLLNRNVS